MNNLHKSHVISNFKLFIYLWSFIKPYKYQLIYSVGILLFSKIILVLVPLGIKYSVDVLQKKDVLISFMSWTLFEIKELTINQLAFFIFTALTLHFVSSWFQVILATRFAQNITVSLKKRLFAHVLKQTLKFFDKNKIGNLLTRTIYDVEALNQLLTTGIMTILGDIFLIFCILILAFILNIKLAIVCLLILPVLYFLIIFFSKQNKNSFMNIRKSLAKMNAFLQNMLSGIKIIQAFNQENKMLSIFKKITKIYLKRYLKTVKIYSFYFPTIDFLSICPQIIFIALGGYWLYIDEISLSTVIAFNLFSPIFFTPLKQISDQLNSFQSAVAASKRIFLLLSDTRLIEQNKGNYNPQNIRGEIEFKNVSFGYKKEKLILKNISFKINKGEKIALLGLTGSGKTTIINLISRLYEINKGEILLDGINIKNYNKKTLRKFITYVLQDFYVFSGSIKENILLFDKTISDNELIQTVNKIKSHKFIEKLPNKYNTLLGEKGVGLSFGEKQLLSFARTFFNKKPILIFDEATSNIDLETEKLIQKNIDKIIKNKTVIIIAHRLSTIKKVDRIIVLHKGKIKESGSHTKLIKNKGLYWKLSKLNNTI